MLVVHEKRKKPGKLEVAWTWFPFFIAADSDLIESVDTRMTEMFSGQDLRCHDVGALMLRMHNEVLDMVCARYQFKGLRKYLEAICEVDPATRDELEPK